MNKLAYWRAKRGLTVRELESISGVSASTISKIEKGHRPAHLSTLGKLAAKLEIDVTELAELAEVNPAGKQKAA
jgi:transcriptional regulator with XRE-family HTH domain